MNEKLDYTNGECTRHIHKFEDLTKTRLDDWSAPVIQRIVYTSEKPVVVYDDYDGYTWIEPFGFYLRNTDPVRYNLIQKSHDDNRDFGTSGEILWINSCEYCGHGIYHEKYFIVNDVVKLKMRIGSFCVKYFYNVMSDTDNVNTYKLKLMLRQFNDWWMDRVIFLLNAYPQDYGYGYHRDFRTGKYAGGRLYAEPKKLLKELMSFNNFWTAPTLKQLKHINTVAKNWELPSMFEDTDTT